MPRSSSDDATSLVSTATNGTPPSPCSTSGAFASVLPSTGCGGSCSAVSAGARPRAASSSPFSLVASLSSVAATVGCSLALLAFVLSLASPLVPSSVLVCPSRTPSVASAAASVLSAGSNLASALVGVCSLSRPAEPFAPSVDSATTLTASSVSQAVSLFAVGSSRPAPSVSSATRSSAGISARAALSGTLPVLSSAADPSLVAPPVSEAALLSTAGSELTFSTAVSAAAASPATGLLPSISPVSLVALSSISLGTSLQAPSVSWTARSSAVSSAPTAPPPAPLDPSCASLSVDESSCVCSCSSHRSSLSMVTAAEEGVAVDVIVVPWFCSTASPDTGSSPSSPPPPSFSATVSCSAGASPLALRTALVVALSFLYARTTAWMGLRSLDDGLRPCCAANASSNSLICAFRTRTSDDSAGDDADRGSGCCGSPDVVLERREDPLVLADVGMEPGSFLPAATSTPDATVGAVDGVGAPQASSSSPIWVYTTGNQRVPSRGMACHQTTNNHQVHQCQWRSKLRCTDGHR
eukprot:m.1170112 g.1170112  ORF g.1170112 m.1170112 type:complete len:526 (+) comp24510_c0_seq11:4344-5921(+)